MVELRGRRVVLRPVEPEDVDRLWSILREPAVAERWGPFDRAEIQRDLVGSDEAFAIEVDGEIVGAIQYGEEEDPMYRHASVDVFLTNVARHDGLLMELLAEDLVDPGA